MLTVTVEFTHGWLRAGPASDARLTGGDRQGEWPPSPARLLAAFVAADGTLERQRVTDGSELALLEQAQPPVIHADPDDQVLRVELNDRFVVRDRREKGSSVHTYPARKSALVRPGIRLVPKDPQVAYCYETAEVHEEQLEALRLRAARIGYFGAADAPARVTVRRGRPAAPTHTWRCDDDGRTVLSVGYPGMVADLDAAFEQFTSGLVVERSWLPKRVVHYRADSQEAPSSPVGETIWLRFTPSIASHHMLSVAEALRAAVLRHHPEGEAAPGIVHGHGMQQAGWHQVRYLPLVEAGHRYAKGRIHGAAIWLPPTATRFERGGMRTAVLSIRRLWAGDRFDVGVMLHDGEPRPWTANPARWVGPSRRWMSVTPVVQERHGAVTDEEVGRWFVHAGHPVPARFNMSRSPFLSGAIDLPPPVVRRRYGRAPYAHLTVEFDEPVEGPMAVGRGRSFGLGLLAPVKEGRRDGA